MIRKLSLLVTLLSGAACAAIRIIEWNTGVIDHATGFYTQPSMWRWVLYAVIAATAIFVLVTALTDRYLVNHIYFKKTAVLGVGSVLFGAYVLLHSATLLLDQPIGVVSIILIVLGAAAGVLMLITGVNQFRNQAPNELMRLSSLVTILWAIGIAALRYTSYNVILTIEQHLIEVVLIICALFFLLGAAWLQFRSKRKRGKRMIAFFGSMTFVLGIAAAAPVLFAGLTSGVPTMLVGSMAVLDLAVALYALCNVLYLSITNH